MVAAIIEVSHDDRGIIWPIEVAPFKVSVINLNIKDENNSIVAENLYNQLRAKNIDTLLDDTNERPGGKFATADLIGSPWQIIVGPKKSADGLVELKNRKFGEIIDVSPEAAIEKISASIV